MWGLDVHKKTCYGTVMDAQGVVVKRGKFANNPEMLEEFLDGLEEASVSVAMEAGYCWKTLWNWLEDEGYDAHLAHPKKVKALAEVKKTDRVDSETLAHLHRTGMLPESYVPPREIRVLRDRVRRWAFLVRMRTKLKNRVHSELDREGINLGVQPFTREGMTLLRDQGLEGVVPLLPLIEVLDVQIKGISARLRRICRENKEAELLTTIPGVGYYIALLIVSEIGDVSRFPDSEKLCSYAGLVPRVKRSGDSTRHGGITKEGSRWLRWALTQAVHVHVRYDSRLTRFYRRLARKKPRQVAVIATARKMLKAVYWMLRNNQPFHPEPEAYNPLSTQAPVTGTEIAHT